MAIPRSLLLSLLPLLLTTATSVKVRGIPPTKEHLYQPDTNGQWSCLSNPELKLSFSQVNDDFCDCPDGSDEPGTAACPNSEFYCANDGFKPSYIKSYLVNDGVCDYELCCDGSDEWATGVECPNRCAEIHAAKAKERDEKLNELKGGLDALQGLLKRAKVERGVLEGDLVLQKAKIAKIDDEILQLKSRDDYRDHDQEVEDKAKAQDILNEIKTDVSSKFNTFIEAKEYHIKLSDIFKSLEETFNENINDAAVKKTIEDYHIHLNNYNSEYDADVNDPNAHPSKAFEEVNKIVNSSFKSIIKNYSTLQNHCTTALTKYLDVIKRTTELENILKYFIHNYNPNFNDPNVKKAVAAYQDLAVNKATTEPVANSFIDDLFQNHLEIVRYVENLKPKALIQYDAVVPLLTLKQRIQYRFRKLVNDFIGQEYNPNPIPIPDNYIPSTVTPADTINVKIDTLNKERIELEKSIHELEEQLSKDYGPNDILKVASRLTGKVGDYDYSIDFTGGINQRNAQSSVNIGGFEGVTVEEISDLEYQLRLRYDHGARCWNGPIRKATVIVSCGDKEEIVSVSELEKCEYEFKVKSPVGCKVVDLENFKDLL